MLLVAAAFYVPLAFENWPLVCYRSRCTKGVVMNRAQQVAPVAVLAPASAVSAKDFSPVALARLVAEVEGPAVAPGRYNRTHNRHNR